MIRIVDAAMVVAEVSQVEADNLVGLGWHKWAESPAGERFLTPAQPSPPPPSGWREPKEAVN